MAPQTTTTKLDTPEGQGTRPADAADGSSPGEDADANFKGSGRSQPTSSDPLPKPNDRLSAEKVNEQELDVDFVAEEDEKVFNKAFLNEDHVLQEYWKYLEQILETPCDNRAKAYENLHKRIGSFKPALRYEHMRDDLLHWATNGFEGKPKISFMDENGKIYHEPKTEEDVKWKNPGHNKYKPTDEIILPADMEFFTTLYEKEVTPLIGQIFDKPKLVQQEPGQKLAAINDQIQARVAEEQKKMKVGENPKVINVDLQVPIKQLLQLMIRGTSELVKCGKNSVKEIEDPNTLSAYALLETQLERAKQPSIWYQSLGTLVESKTKRWREHLQAQSDITADENLWDGELEGFVLGRAPDPEYIKQYYDGRNAPGNLASDKKDVPQEMQESGQDSGSVKSNDVDMSDESHQDESSNPADRTGTSGPTTDSNTSREQQHEKFGTSVFADAVKIECEPAYVLDGGSRRKIEGYLAVGRGHSLLIRMNEAEAVPAKCDLTAAGPFGRSALNKYQALGNARHIKRQTQTELTVLEDKSITDLHCTFIATQRGTCSRTIIGGRFEDDDPSVERHYFQSQLDRAMGKACVDGWIRTIWPELFENNEDDLDISESSTDEPLTRPTQKEAMTQKGTPGNKKSASTAQKPANRHQVNETPESQLKFMQTNLAMMMKQLEALQSSMGSRVQT